MFVHPSIDKDSPYLCNYNTIDEIVKIVQVLLDNCSNAIGKENKIVCMRYIFTVICSNKWFTDTQPKFRNTVLLKLKELYIETEISSEINEYFKIITGKNIDEYSFDD